MWFVGESVLVTPPKLGDRHCQTALELNDHIEAEGTREGRKQQQRVETSVARPRVVDHGMTEIWALDSERRGPPGRSSMAYRDTPDGREPANGPARHFEEMARPVLPRAGQVDVCPAQGARVARD